MGSLGASGQASGSQNHQGNLSDVTFPANFLDQFTQVFGPGVTQQQLLAGLPHSQSLFGNNPVGIFPQGGGQQPPPQGYGPPPGAGGLGFNPVAMAANPYQSGPGAYAPMAYGGGQGGGYGPAPGGGQAQGGGSPQIPYSAIVADMMQNYGGNAQSQNARGAQLNQALQSMGLQPGQSLSLGQLQELQNRIGYQGNSTRSGLQLTGELSALGNLQQPTNAAPFTASGSPSTFDASQGLANLGIGQLPQNAQAPTIGQAPSIYAPQAGAAQMNIAPQGFQQYQNQIYQQQFDPTQQQIQRSGAIADRQLNSDLAARGLSASAAGQGQMQQARQERQNQLNNASVQAANNASVQAFGAQYGQAQQNAQLQQQTALQNANLDQQAQTQNASNVLTGNIQNATAYLQTLGLNNQQAQSARTNFLQAAGLNETDLARMDSVQQQTLGMFLNEWLQQGALVSGAGQVNQGYDASRSWSRGGGASASVASTGG